MIRRRFLTLIEMMIVLAILSLVVGVIGINISNAVIDQRFRGEVGRVVDELRLAQDIMLILGTDVHVVFSEDREKGGIKYLLDIETTMDPAWEKELKRTRQNLQTIRGVFFADQTAQTSPSKGKIDLRFLSGGSVMSKGVLRLATSDQEDPPKGTLQNYICLPGFPFPINSSDTLPEECTAMFDEVFLKRLTQDTMDRVPPEIKDLKAISEAQKKDESATVQAPPPQPNKEKTPRQPPVIKTRVGQQTPTALPPK